MNKNRTDYKMNIKKRITIMRNPENITVKIDVYMGDQCWATQGYFKGKSVVINDLKNPHIAFLKHYTEIYTRNHFVVATGNDIFIGK